MLKTDQKAESAETSEKAQVDQKAAVVQLHASHERSSSAMEAHPTKAHGKAADEESADDEESVRHRDRHASRHSKHNSRHRSKHGEEHMQLTDAFGKQYTHKSVNTRPQACAATLATPNQQATATRPRRAQPR